MTISLLQMTRVTYAYLTSLHKAYMADVEEWYATGDGAASDWVPAGTQEWFDAEWDNPDRMVNIGGKGYRYPACEHGMSLWTDYDNICGGCEDPTPLITQARYMAESALSQHNERLAWAQAAPKSLPTDQATALWKWVFEPISRYTPFE